MIRRPEATISRTCSRRENWLAVFESETVPIESYLPVQGLKPDGSPAEFYKLDVKRLTLDQRRRLIQFLAARWKLPVDEVAKDVDGAHGVPILAEDVVVEVDMRLFV